MNKVKLIENKYIILVILLLSIVFHSFFYQKSITQMSELFINIGKGVNGNVSTNQIETLSFFSNIVKSIQFQVPLNFINTLLGIYLFGIFILIINKIEKKIRKINQQASSFYFIVSCLYISTYIISLDFVVKGIIMMITGVSIDTLSGIAPIVYWLIITVLQAYVFSIKFYKDNAFTWSPIIIYSVYIIISLNIQFF